MLISDFARLGQVSVRMLRHYDALGLLVPDHVEPASGYRSYSPEQLHLHTGSAAVESRLRMTREGEHHRRPTTSSTTLRRSVRLVGSPRRASSDPEATGQHVGPMSRRVPATLRHVDGALATPIATYAEVDEGMEVAVGYAWGGPAPDGTEAIDQADRVTELQQPVTR